MAGRKGPGADGSACEQPAENKQSLEVEWEHLTSFNTLLVMWLADQPKVMLGLFHKAALEAVLDQFPDYTTIHQEVFVRVLNLPIVDSIRDLRYLPPAYSG